MRVRFSKRSRRSCSNRLFADGLFQGRFAHPNPLGKMLACRRPVSQVKTPQQVRAELRESLD